MAIFGSPDHSEYLNLSWIHVIDSYVKVLGGCGNSFCSSHPYKHIITFLFVNVNESDTKTIRKTQSYYNIRLLIYNVMSYLHDKTVHAIVK